MADPEGNYNSGKNVFLVDRQPGDDPIMIPAGVTDAQKAIDFRAEIMPLLEQACQIITRARREGLTIGFSLGPDQNGIQRVQMFDITKSLL